MTRPASWLTFSPPASDWRRGSRRCAGPIAPPIRLDLQGGSSVVESSGLQVDDVVVVIARGSRFGVAVPGEGLAALLDVPTVLVADVGYGYPLLLSVR